MPTIRRPRQPQHVQVFTESPVHPERVLPPLRRSNQPTITGLWYVSPGSKARTPWRYKAFKPGGGTMIKEDEGGGYFDTPEEAAIALRRWCLDHGYPY